MRTDAIQRLNALAHQNFGFYPTPIEELGRLRRQFGHAAPRILIKRDDYTGFALGGNKVRKLEYELAPERVRDIDLIITAGGVNSNHARVTAAACARLGIECVLVLNGQPGDPPRGNAMLQRLFGARVVQVGSRAERSETMERLAGEAAASGKRTMVIPLGASTPQGALGYARAALELREQLATVQLDTGRVWIFVSASSAGTLAGLLLGLDLADLGRLELVGISPDDSGDSIAIGARTIAQGAARLIGHDLQLPEERPLVADQYVGEGYGIATAESRQAIELFARTEGVVLDPVYSAKAAAGMIDWIARGDFSPHDTLIFWHTGGHPALFI